MKKCQKQSGTDEFGPKYEYRQISSSFGQHALKSMLPYASRVENSIVFVPSQKCYFKDN